MNNQRDTKKKKTWNSRPKYMGTVTGWDRTKNYGFIRCYEDGNSYYCNLKMVQDGVRLERGTIVEFEIWHSREDEEQKFAAKVLVVEVPE